MKCIYCKEQIESSEPDIYKKIKQTGKFSKTKNGMQLYWNAHVKCYDEKMKYLINETCLEDISKTYNDMLNTLKYILYEEYLQTDHWLHFRNEALKWAQNKCQICGEIYNLNIHHKTYENKGRETFNDVTVLCRDCHEKLHNKIA